MATGIHAEPLPDGFSTFEFRTQRARKNEWGALQQCKFMGSRYDFIEPLSNVVKGGETIVSTCGECARYLENEWPACARAPDPGLIS